MRYFENLMYKKNCKILYNILNDIFKIDTNLFKEEFCI